MKHFPIICIDDFYENPDEVRKFALGLKYSPSDDGAWPGKRTKMLHEIDEHFFDNFCKKLFSVYYDLNLTNLEWSVKTQFQLIEKFSNDINCPKNKGWIHLDDQTIFAGIIYLTPNINSNCGTSLYRIKNTNSIDSEKNVKSKFYKNKIDMDYNQEIIKHNESFEETVKFNNVYNRLISFDGEVYHGANNFFTENEPRLTQVFFVKYLKSNTHTPLQRFIRKN